MVSRWEKGFLPLLACAEMSLNHKFDRKYSGEISHHSGGISHHSGENTRNEFFETFELQFCGISKSLPVVLFGFNSGTMSFLSKQHSAETLARGLELARSASMSLDKDTDPQLMLEEFRRLEEPYGPMENKQTQYGTKIQSRLSIINHWPMYPWSILPCRSMRYG